ncbi:hypothetical protein I5S84_13395 [Pseudomonas putida]|uniref:Uncharacterized protein n=1 Tax=Pseudomonas putida TaxID=303 RepID=A0ABD7BHC9_PSEPU|nr:DUF6387 family protein [Pseudomonas putida]MBH3449844.1 hypothetical protein [Pseudomonas putida]QOC98988.1 hypothetical protein ID616_04585 [Pseudomonas putida]
MAKIDTVKDLPTWFDLNNYKAVSEFSAKDWLFHIQLRATMLPMLPMLKLDYLSAIPKLQELRKSGSTEAMYILDMVDVLNQVRDTPIDCYLPGNFYWDAARFAISNDGLADQRSIKPLTLYDMLRQKTSDQFSVEDGDADSSTLTLWDYLENGELSAYPEAEIDLDSDEEGQGLTLTELLSREDNYDLFSRTPHIEIKLDRKINEKWHNPAITVDLNAPDAAILKSFKEWLKRERTNSPEGAGTPKKPAFDWWGDYGLLPYLDLYFWSLETDNHIPDRVMANAISADTFGEDRLRKTVKPLASDLNSLIDGLKPFAAEDFG